MIRVAKGVFACALLMSGPLSRAGTPASPATIRNVSVLGAGQTLEVEVLASAPVTPQVLVLTGPDRLVLDFPNALPGERLRNLDVNRGDLKAVRVGRFSSNPVTTRVVLDLKNSQPYQLFPSGKTVILKLGAPNNRPSAQSVAAVSTPPPPPPPKLEVNFSQGKLKIWSNKATLAEVLMEVRRRTGAEMTMPPGAGQEQVVVDIGPAPAREVLASLLNGSPFNFVVIGSDRDFSQLKGIYLTMRGAGATGMSQTYPAVSVAQAQEPDMTMQPSPEPDQVSEPEPAPEPAPQQDMTPNQAPPLEETTPQQ
jgi:hypothetical protein